ncbi:sulfatase [Mucilaginibacter antarcticus]|uniref:Sulfatase n=1 Tax=Mucilaginibacter antarcticus TaxID=1855725 RepID=A0ABW5XMN4_9SPHI
MAQSNAQPNVLFVLIDDLNDYVTQLKGYPGLKTPNLDKFVKTSVNFKKAYCAAPVCNPSRAAMLSGIAPYHSGIYDNDNRIVDSKVLDSAVFLPELFKNNGYTTLTRGKIFHTDPAKAKYDAMWDVKAGKGNYGPNAGVRNVPRELKAPPMFNYAEWTGPESDHTDNVTAETISAQLKQTYTKPFFMAAGLYKPHNPWTAPKRFFDLYPIESMQMPKVLESDWDDLPEIAKGWAASPVDYDIMKKSGKWKEIVRSYLACISFMDYNFGRIIAALDSSAYKNNTIVVVSADNGFHMGEKKHFAKFALWEQTTHILHLWRVPGLTKPDQTCNETVSLLDIYPTLMELCSLRGPASRIDGRSIVPLLKDPSLTWKYPAVTTYKQGNQAIRNQQYRYIRYSDGTEELYDELKDPNEWKNLAKEPSMKKVTEGFRTQISKSFLPATAAVKGGEE